MMFGDAFGQAFGAFIGVMLIFVLAAVTAIYVYTSLATMAIAKKTKTGPLWLAWVPVANILLLLKIAKLQWQWIFALLIVIIPVIGGPLVGAGMIYVWYHVCKARHKEPWLAILMIVPLVNLAVMGYVAWSK